MAKTPVVFDEVKDYIKIASQSITSTSTTFSLNSGYSFSNFKEFIVVFLINSSTRSIIYVPFISMLQGGIYGIIPTSSTIVSAYMQKLTDTTFRAESTAANIIQIYAR